MDLETAKKGFNFTGKNKKWILAAGILGLTSFGAYRAYNSPEMVKKREKLLKLFSSLSSLAEIVSDSADSMAILSKDFNNFIQSDSDQIPKSLRPISKIAKFDEVSEPLVKITTAITIGILQGYQKSDINSSCIDSVMDKFFTDSGTGFASIVAGSFAKNLVMAIYSESQNNGGLNWVNNVLCDEKCTELIGNWVRQFVSTAVTVYLEKTMKTNTYDEIFSGLTNPNHETRMKNILVDICHAAMETFIKTSHQVFTNASESENANRCQNKLMVFEMKPKKQSVFVDRMCSALSGPRNRRFLIDLSGKVTFETMKSFQEFVLEKLSQSLRRRVDSVRDKVSDSGAEALGFMRYKSSSAITTCLSLCLHIVNSPWLLVPP